MVLEGLGTAFKAIPDSAWGIIHLVTALVAFWFAYKSKDNKQWMWAFVLYGITGVLYTFVHFGQVDSYATHILETVLVFVAFIMVGMSAMKK